MASKSDVKGSCANHNVRSARHRYPILLRKTFGSNLNGIKCWKPTVKRYPVDSVQRTRGSSKITDKKQWHRTWNEILKTETLANCNVEWVQKSFQGQYKESKVSSCGRFFKHKFLYLDDQYFYFSMCRPLKWGLLLLFCRPTDPK